MELVNAKQRQREAFAEKRLRALTMMLLTRRENLLIEEVNEGIGLNYIVRFRTHDEDGLREFGIALRGLDGRDQADCRPSASADPAAEGLSLARPACFSQLLAGAGSG